MEEIDNLNYNLYKLIFNNIYLSKRIYKFIKIINKQITNEIKSYTRIIKYQQANYEWIIKNNKYSLFIDKIKQGIPLDSIYFSNDNELCCFFNYFFKSIKECYNDDTHDKIEKLLLKKLLKTNRNSFNNIKPVSLKTHRHCQLNLLKYSIGLSNFNFFKIVIKELKLKYQPAKIDEKEFKDTSYGNDEYITKNRNLLKYAFEIGNLKIIKYLIDVIGLKFCKNSVDQIIPCSVTSVNRDQVIQFLLSDYGEQHSNLISNVTDTEPQNLNGFTGKLWLNHSLFKQLYEMGEPIFYGKPFTHRNLANILYGHVKADYLYDGISFNELTNYIQNSLFILSLVDNKFNLYSNLLLKKVYHLIKYNDIIVGGGSGGDDGDNIEKEYLKLNYQKNKYTLENEDIITIKQFDTITVNNKSNEIDLLSKIKNIFSKTTKTKPEESIKPTVQHSINSSLDDIHFGEIGYYKFNLEREMYRVYIFDFVFKIFTFENPNFMETSKLISNFAIQFNEHHLILNKILNQNGKPIDQYDKSQLFSYLILCSLKKADSELIKFISQHMATPELPLDVYLSNLIRNRMITGKKDHQFDIELTPIEKQVQFVITFINLGLNFDHIINHIINGKNEINIDPILNALVVDNGTFFKEVDIKPFLGNENYHGIEQRKFIHCFNNFNKLFKWDDYLIGKLVIETGNLQLMSFLYQNKIGGFDNQDSNSMINYSTSNNVAQFMYDKFNYKFNLKSLYIFSQLDEWNSNYLFYYSFRKLVEQYNQDFNFNDFQQFIVILPKSNLFKYKQLYFIKSIVLNEKLIDQDRIKIGYADSLNEIGTKDYTSDHNSFTSFVKVNLYAVLSSFNLKYIYQFLIENQGSNLNSNLDLLTFNGIMDFLEFEKSNNIAKNNQKIDYIKDFLLKFQGSNTAKPYY